MSGNRPPSSKIINLATSLSPSPPSSRSASPSESRSPSPTTSPTSSASPTISPPASGPRSIESMEISRLTLPERVGSVQVQLEQLYSQFYRLNLIQQYFEQDFQERVNIINLLLPITTFPIENLRGQRSYFQLISPDELVQSHANLIQLDQLDQTSVTLLREAQTKGFSFISGITRQVLPPFQDNYQLYLAIFNDNSRYITYGQLINNTFAY